MLLVTLTAITCEVSRDRKGKRKNDSIEKSLWKKEYEDELTDAMLSSKKKDNFTRVPQSTSMSDNEMVIEKLMDSITSSEKYLKKVDSVDFRLNRLDIEVHEKTNAILKRLTDIMKSLETHPYEDKVDVAIDNIKTDIGHIKGMLEHNPRADGRSYGTVVILTVYVNRPLDTLRIHIYVLMKQILRTVHGRH